MWIVFPNRKFYVCGWWGFMNFNVKQLSTTFRTSAACKCGIRINYFTRVLLQKLTTCSVLKLELNLQSVCGASIFRRILVWLVCTGHESANRTGHCCTRRLELLVSLRSVLAEGPRNESMMTRQTTLFGTVVEKGRFY